jgi:hypothetical protein
MKKMEASMKSLFKLGIISSFLILSALHSNEDSLSASEIPSVQNRMDIMMAQANPLSRVHLIQRVAIRPEKPEILLPVSIQ